MADVSTPPTSPFLSIPPSAWVASNELAFAILDRFPVCPGHTLVVPRRLVTTYFEASAAEKVALWALVDEVKIALDQQLHPGGYNVGFNAGEAAGQTVLHLHIHVIPRFPGDVADPRGGVRHVIPARANYLLQDERRSPLATGGEHDPFGRHLWPLFANASEIAIVAAFVTETGLAILEERVFAALRNGATVRIVTGDLSAARSPETVRGQLGAPPGVEPDEPELLDRENIHSALQAGAQDVGDEPGGPIVGGCVRALGVEDPRGRMISAGVSAGARLGGWG